MPAPTPSHPGPFGGRPDRLTPPSSASGAVGCGTYANEVSVDATPEVVPMIAMIESVELLN